MLAALRPRMLSLAAERAAGAHPYFVPVEHTVRAREVLGAGALLAPEVTVVLEKDPSRRGRQPGDSRRAISPSRTTPTISAYSGSETTTLPEAAATDSSTPSWPGANRTTSLTAYVSTS